MGRIICSKHGGTGTVNTCSHISDAVVNKKETNTFKIKIYFKRKILMKTLIFSGTPRENGNTMVLVNEFINHLNGEYKIIDAYA